MAITLRAIDLSSYAAWGYDEKTEEFAIVFSREPREAVVYHPVTKQEAGRTFMAGPPTKAGDGGLTTILLKPVAEVLEVPRNGLLHTTRSLGPLRAALCAIQSGAWL